MGNGLFRKSTFGISVLILVVHIMYVFIVIVIIDDVAPYMGSADIRFVL